MVAEPSSFDEHFNAQNTSVQGKKKVATNFYDTVCAFHRKLSLVETVLIAMQYISPP